MKRVAVVGLWHETNTYAAQPTLLSDFEAFELVSGDPLVERNRSTGSVLGGFYDCTDFDLVPVFSAGAWPSGPIEAATMADLMGHIDANLRSARGLDGVLLNLHGATVAEDLADVETAVTDVVREIVGARPIAAVLDLHGNPSRSLVEGCDVLISYDTYPHVDMRERGREAGNLMGQLLAGHELRTKIGKLPLLVCPLAQGTETGSPFERLQRHASERARRAGIKRVCIVGGFAYSDVERAGMSVLALHRPDQEELAREVINETLADIQASAVEFAITRDDPATAVAKAITSTKRPVFLVDTADNIGGGAPGDGTTLLAELLAQGASGAVLTLADSEVAEQALRAGVGAQITARLGGKTDQRHGAPIAVHGQVVRLSDGNYRSAGYYLTNRSFSMGNTAVLSIAGNTVVVTENPTPPFHAEQLAMLGIDVRRASIVVMKGALAWRGAYEGVPGEIIEAATPGICPVDVASLPRRTAPAAS